MYAFSVTPLFEAHLEEVCQDLKNQYEKGITICPLFCMTLTPEGNPIQNKAKNLCDKYRKFKARLDELGVPSGVLVQATIGHGWTQGQPAPIQRIVNMTDGGEPYAYCPTSKEFKEYVRNAFKEIASCKPKHIMLDDDYRLVGSRPGKGCGCAEHMRRFNEAAKSNVAREELYKILYDLEDERCAEYRKIFLKVQSESLLETAKIMREAIDEVDPTIPGSICAAGQFKENAEEMAEIFAGKGNKTTIRGGSHNYMTIGFSNFSNIYMVTARDIQRFGDKCEIFVAETDTYPQNRYSTAAVVLDTHCIQSILEGAKGAKHWITRMREFEPESGVAYRKVLAKNAKLYKKLIEIVDGIKYTGARIPTNITNEINFKFYSDPGYWTSPEAGFNHWATLVFEKMGFPMYFSDELEGLSCFEETYYIDLLSDDQVLQMLSKGAILASDTAKRLVQRGFKEYIGVDVKEWNGKNFTREESSFGAMSAQIKAKQLIPISSDVKVLSVAQNAVGVLKEDLFPAVTEFTNKLGGTVFVFAGTPRTHFGNNLLWSLLCSTRKKQFVEMFRKTGNLACYYPGDEQVYVKAGITKGGELLGAITSLGFDVIENLEIGVEKAPTRVKKLSSNGELEEVEFNYENGIVKTNLTIQPYETVILLMK